MDEERTSGAEGSYRRRDRGRIPDKKSHMRRLTGRDKDDIKKKEFRRIYGKGWRHTVGKWKKYMAHIGTYPAALGKWLAVGGFIGGIGGVIGSLFHIGVNYATQTRGQHPWILYLLPALGLIIAGLYRVTKVEGKDTNAVIESVHFGKNVPVLLVPVIFIATVLTHLGGGSAGREGAALQIGGGIGHTTGRLLRLGEKDLPLATLCGMSAVFSALFGTPLTATIFAMEVISVGVFYYAGLLPCLTAALMGYLVSLLMGVPPTRFTVANPGLDAWTMVLVILLAIGCAVASILFCRGLQETGRLAAKLLPSPFVRAFVGGVLVIGLTLLVGNGDYNGAGMEVVERAMSGQVRSWAWLLKLLFTAVTIGFGFKGGEVVPSFFVGACFGCVLGQEGGLLVTNPIPEKYSMDPAVINKAIDEAVAECKAKGVHGKETTPFLLAKVKDLTGGDSLDSNIQLVYNNARVASAIACSLSKLEKQG